MSDEIHSGAHEHPLALCERGGWNCDGRNIPGGCRGGTNQKRFRCTQGCDYDLCEKCTQIQMEKSPLHEHQLVEFQSTNRWSCDGKKAPQGCKGHCDAMESRDVQRFRCARGCDYDLCLYCLNPPKSKRDSHLAIFGFLFFLLLIGVGCMLYFTILQPESTPPTTPS
jgi:hypothetical protein